VAERPDLEEMTRSLDAMDAEGWSDHAPNDYLADSLRAVIDYALALERQHAASQERAASAERERDRLATDALIALAGSHVGTPVEGYVEAPWCLKGDIERLAQERDAAKRAKEERYLRDCKTVIVLGNRLHRALRWAWTARRSSAHLARDLGAARAALAKYGRHTQSCDLAFVSNPHGWLCSCGWSTQAPATEGEPA
jgi:hypothetical protein